MSRYTVTGVFATLVAAAALCDSTSAAEAQGPDFTGYWMRPEGGNARIFYPPEQGPGPLTNLDETREFMIGDDANPILQPHAAAAVRAHGDRGRAGEVLLPAWSLCWPPGLPLILNMAEPVQLLQDAEKVTIIYQRGMLYRQIFLNEKHEENLTPAWMGHSVGHYEGTDTLVIDTIGQDTRSLVDRFGTPKSDALRVVERYTLSPDREQLWVEFMLEDPKTFTVPWSGRMTFVRPSGRDGYDPGGFNRDGEAISESVCPENNRDASGGVYPIPTSNGPDF